MRGRNMRVRTTESTFRQGHYVKANMSWGEKKLTLPFKGSYCFN